MTKREKTGLRDLSFNVWMRENLPDSSEGLLITDVDAFLRNYKTGNSLLMEVKTGNTSLQFWQAELYKIIHDALIKADPGFMGFHLITFAGSPPRPEISCPKCDHKFSQPNVLKWPNPFDSGPCFISGGKNWDGQTRRGKEVSEDEVKVILNRVCNVRQNG